MYFCFIRFPYLLQIQAELTVMDNKIPICVHIIAKHTLFEFREVLLLFICNFQHIQFKYFLI